MNESIFKRDKLIPFLAYMTSDLVSGVALHAIKPEDEHYRFNLDDVFKTCQVTRRTSYHPQGIEILCNQVAAYIAVQTKRAMGNVLFIHPDTNKKRLEQNAGFTLAVDRMTVVEDYSVPVDEIRMMYHRPGDVVMDGPFQIVGGKLYCNPNYRLYFGVGKL